MNAINSLLRYKSIVTCCYVSNYIYIYVYFLLYVSLLYDLVL